MGKVMERRYICKNGIVEKTRFRVGSNSEERPRWRKAKSETDKREENLHRAVKELARILNCNADGSGYLVKLDYSPESWEELFVGKTEDEILTEAKRQAGLFVRRLKRSAGEELKCVYTASDRERNEDGELMPVRVHNHLVILGATEEQIREKWTLGSCTDIRRLYANQEDYTPLAAYLVLQVRSLPNFRKFTATKNMDKPKIEDRIVTGDPEAEIRVQPGAKVLDRMTYREGSVVQYVRYKRRPPKPKRGGRKENPPAEPIPQEEGDQWRNNT